MIESLRILNFAIIDELHIDFKVGLSMLTGETGTGKSIIIDAIGQLCGQRAQTTFIKSGCEKAFIEGVFDISNNPIVKKQLVDLDFEEDDQLVISKTLQNDGKTNIKVNYRNVSNILLKQLMVNIVDIHSQFETHSLFDEKKHQDLLDAFCHKEIKDLLSKYQQNFNTYKQLLIQKDDLLQQTFDDEQIDFYKARLEEIDSIDLEEIDEDELIKQKKAIQNYQYIHDSIKQFQYFLKESNVDAMSLLQQANNALSNLQDEEDFQELSTQFNDLTYQIHEIDQLVMEKFEQYSYDPYQIKDINEKLQMISRLKRKYGNSINSVIEKKNELIQSIQLYENREDYLQKIDQQIKKLEVDLQNDAQKLHQIRKKSAIEFEKSITSHLKDLYLEKVTFKINFIKTDYTMIGIDKIQFLISTNVGSIPKPLSKVSSGGELSRIMLAIKIITLQFSPISLLIFDEADTGVSGKVAESIGQKMKKISKNMQVICITHLAQVAAFCDHHYHISKAFIKNQTNVSIEYLNEESSIEEIAKMISGATISKESIEHARILKNQCRKDT